MAALFPLPAASRGSMGELIMRKIYFYFRDMTAGSVVLKSFFEAVPVVVLVGIVYVLFRARRLKKRGEGVAWGAELMRLLFVCYLTGLICLVLLPSNLLGDLYDGIFLGRWGQLGPFFRKGDVSLNSVLLRWLRGEYALGGWITEMLVYNVAMFIPFGFFLPFLSEKLHGKRAFLVAALFPLAVELLQPIFGRSFDIDDLICNFIGASLGLLLALGIRKLTARRGQDAR